MAWWAGRRSGQGGYGTHQEKKEGSRHKRPGDRKWALEDAADDCTVDDGIDGTPVCEHEAL